MRAVISLKKHTEVIHWIIHRGEQRQRREIIKFSAISNFNWTSESNWHKSSDSSSIVVVVAEKVATRQSARLQLSSDFIFFLYKKFVSVCLLPVCKPVCWLFDRDSRIYNSRLLKARRRRRWPVMWLESETAEAIITLLTLFRIFPFLMYTLTSSMSTLASVWAEVGRLTWYAKREKTFRREVLCNATRNFPL